MIITPDKIEQLYKIEKRCFENIKWNPVPNSDHDHLTFYVPILTIENELLYWRGYYERFEFGIKKHGFILLFNHKYCIRSLDMAKKHYSKKERRYVRGIGCHKHYYLDDDTPRDVYSIPEGEISLTDSNQAVYDFAKECNIILTGGYQSQLL